MTPFTTPEDGRHNWRFIVVVVWLVIFTLMTSYALKQASNANDATADLAKKNTRLIYKVHRQQIQIQSNAADAAYRLCLSVRRGKLDRIDEYKFTLQRTEEFFKENPSTQSDASLQRTIDFYHDLIQRTQDQIVPCKNPQGEH